MHLCEYPIGNMHHQEWSTASAQDAMYDTLFRKVQKFMATNNPCTNRPRQFFTTADKGTELNQRQVINIHLYDVDGRLKKIHGTAHLINEIPIVIEEGDAEIEESTGKALLEHHY